MLAPVVSSAICHFERSTQAYRTTGGDLGRVVATRPTTSSLHRPQDLQHLCSEYRESDEPHPIRAHSVDNCGETLMSILEGHAGLHNAEAGRDAIRPRACNLLDAMTREYRPGRLNFSTQTMQYC